MHQMGLINYKTSVRLSTAIGFFLFFYCILTFVTQNPKLPKYNLKKSNKILIFNTPMTVYLCLYST